MSIAEIIHCLLITAVAIFKATIASDIFNISLPIFFICSLLALSERWEEFIKNMGAL